MKAAADKTENKLEIEFKLDAFEGPLSVLLGLIEKNKIDIYDIPIVKLTDQYLEYIRQLETEDLELLSDFLVMASTLLDIKARMLLPKEEAEEQEDPRAELVARLTEYREYKMMAELLRESYENPSSPLYKAETIPDEVKEYEVKPEIGDVLSNISFEKLTALFQTVMKRVSDKIDPVRSGFGDIKRDPVRISDKLMHIINYGGKHNNFTFIEICEGSTSKADLVVTFLACLELIKIGQITVSQEEIFGDIKMEWNSECRDALNVEEIKDYD